MKKTLTLISLVVLLKSQLMVVQQAPVLFEDQIITTERTKDDQER